MKRILALLMAMAMVFAFAACSKDGKDTKAASETAEDKAVEVEAEVEAEVEPEVDADAEAVEAYVDLVAAELESAMQNDQMALEVEAEGTSVVYRFSYKDPQYTGPEMEKALEDGIDSAASTFEDSLELMKAEEPAVSAIVIEYYDANGDILAERTFR